MNNEKLKLLAKDLTREYPRSPRETLAGYVIAARILTVYYFGFFFVILPLLGLFEKTKPLPNSISESVLRHGVPAGASAPPPTGAKA